MIPATSAMGSDVAVGLLTGYLDRFRGRRQAEACRHRDPITVARPSDVASGTIGTRRTAQIQDAGSGVCLRRACAGLEILPRSREQVESAGRPRSSKRPTTTSR